MIKEEVPSAKLIIEEREVDKRNYKVCFKKIKEELNFSPDYTVREGILELIRELRKKPDLDHNRPIYSNVKFLKENVIIPT